MISIAMKSVIQPAHLRLGPRLERGCAAVDDVRATHPIATGRVLPACFSASWARISGGLQERAVSSECATRMAQNASMQKHVRWQTLHCWLQLLPMT